MTQRFKVMLQQALGSGAQRIRLVAGQSAQVVSPQGTLQQDGIYPDTEIHEILGIVMPNQAFDSQGKMAGALNVGPLGILKLRAYASPLRLDIYSASGEDLLAKDMTLAPLPPPPPALAPPPQMATPKSIPLVADPVPAKNAPAEVATDDVSAMFRTMPVKTKKPAAAAIEDSAFAPPEAAPAMIQAVNMAQPVTLPAASTVVVAPSPESQAVPAIDFGNQEKSEGSFSDGHNVIDKFLREMTALKASDMHLTIGQPLILRVHGDISRVGNEVITSEMMERMILPTMPERNRWDFAKASDTDYAYELGGIGRFRVNVFRDRNGVGAVLRHIPSQILTADQLGLSPAITKLCHLSKGLVLVTGPTGSGKSTTLAAMLDLINKTRKEHILTVEDPIEFVHPQQMCLVNQREVHKHTNSFARALKAALREDPDVVLIGEMRDLETIAIAIETAETGHLVFGTLHTTTAMSTVDRIIDQFPSDRQAQIRTMLASSLRGVVAQTLLKKKGGGRVAAHEILISNDAVAAMIREGKIQHLANHMLTQKADGNQLLNDALMKLVQDGVVDAQDAYFKSVDKNSFLALAKSRGINIAA